MKNDRLTLTDLEQWVDNDEGLYNWWKSERKSKRAFIKENREELTRCITEYINRPPREKTWRDYC